MPSPIGHPPYNVNGEGGRPKRYTESYVNELADDLEKWLEDKANIFIERFCLKHDIPEDTIAKDLIKHERFSRAYNKLRSKQKVSLFENGLTGKFKHNMCALVLSHNHGVHQKTEQKISGDAANPLSFIIQNIDGATKELVND